MSCCKCPIFFFMMLLVFIINSYVQMNCCKHHIIAPTGFEPIKLFAVKNTDMFRRFPTTDKLGQWQGVDSNHQHVPCNGKNDCCGSHEHDLQSFTALPIELPCHIYRL